MTVAPVEYVVVQFPGLRFTSAVARAITSLARAATIRLLDLVFVAKLGDGTVVAHELEDLDELAELRAVDGEIGGLIAAEDIEYVSATLAPGTSVALLLWEDVWARPIAEALAHDGAVLAEGARVPRDLIEPALARVDGD